MAEVVLFHSVLGLRPGVLEAAERMEAAGHKVHVPDLYDGHPPFDTYEPAMQLQEQIGFAELSRRAEAAVADLPNNLVYAGFSMGVAPAEMLAAKRAGARGALLIAGANSLQWFGVEAWPGTVPVQVHYATDDPYREQDELQAFAAAVQSSGAPYVLFEYPVSGHLFTDPGLGDEYHAQSADLLYTRVLEFLGNL